MGVEANRLQIEQTGNKAGRQALETSRQAGKHLKQAGRQTLFNNGRQTGKLKLLPSKAPLQFRAALALSALVNSTNAMRVG